jgi:hypothetical protein
MSFWGKEDRDFFKLIKECIEHWILIIVLLLIYFVTLWIRATLFPSNDDILQFIIITEKIGIILTVGKYCVTMIVSWYASVRKVIRSV